MEEHTNIYNQCRLETSNRLTKIETILEQQNKSLEKILEQTTKTNGRVTSLENFKSKVLGIVLAISTMVSFIGWVISNILK